MAVIFNKKTTFRGGRTVSGEIGDLLYVTGRFTSYNGIGTTSVCAIKSDGTIVRKATLFTDPTPTNLYAINLTYDNYIFLGGDFRSFNSDTDVVGVTKIDTKNLDSNIKIGKIDGLGKKVYAIASGMGGTFIAGDFNAYGKDSASYLVKVNLDGTIDYSFTNYGFDGPIYSLCFDEYERLVVGGAFSTYSGITYGDVGGVVRLLKDGTPDGDFKPGTTYNGAVKTVAAGVMARGIYVGGEFTTVAGSNSKHMTKLNAQGEIDIYFTNLNFDDSVYTINVDSLGGVYVGGKFTVYNSNNYGSIIKLDGNGYEDSGFNVINGGFDGNVYKIALDANNNLYVVGGFTNFNGEHNNCIIKLLKDGSIDKSFDSGGASGGFDSEVFDIIVT